MDMTIDTVSADGCDRAAVRAVRGDLPGGGPRQLHRHLHRLHQQAHAGQPGWRLSTSAANRLIGEFVQSRRRPLLGLSHLRHY